MLYTVDILTCRFTHEDLGEKMKPAYLFNLFVFLQDYDGDFPPEILEKIFSPMSQMSQVEPRILQKQTKVSHELGNNVDANSKAHPSPPVSVIGGGDSVISCEQSATHSCKPNSRFHCISSTSNNQTSSNIPTYNHTNRHHQQQQQKLASSPMESQESPEESNQLKKRRRLLKEKMCKLLSYDKPLPLPALPNAGSPAIRKDFRSPLPKKS